MSGFSLFILTVISIWMMAYFRTPLFLWTVILSALLLTFQSFGWIGFAAWFLWPLLLIIVIPLNLPFIRRRFTQKIFEWFKNVLPPMSATEKEAIEAGDVWWEKELFQGKPNWHHLLEIPKPELNANEQAFLENQVETLCGMLNDWEIVHEKSDLPIEVWNYLKKEKFFGMIIPKVYGGLEFSPQAHSAVITKLGTRSISAAVTAMVPNSLGPAELLLYYGTNEQKNYYLPRLADGREIPCFALTGPEAGSDASAMTDTGIICKDFFNGKEIIGIRLNFDKRYITLAPIATVLGVAFKLFDPNQLLSNKRELGITLCLIPTCHPGLEIGHRHFPLNMAFMNGPVRGKDVFVPVDWIIGGEQNAGKGWQMLMECLSAGRGISLPALSTATGVLAYRMTGAYAAIRKQFNVPISSFEGVEEALARIGGNTYTLQATRLLTASAIAQGKKPSVATAIAKYHMTEMARKVVNDAMDIHAGRGIMLGPFNYIGRAYQSIPVSITVEGANILTRSLILFGQGAIRCHPFAFNEMKAAELSIREPEKALALFDENCIKHIGYVISNVIRTLTLSLTRGHFSALNFQDRTKKYIKKLNWMSAAFSLSTDIALFTLGGDLKRKERISARFGDILSHFYIASAVIKYYHDQNKPLSDWPLVQWSLESSLYQAQEAFYGICNNFPVKYIGHFLKWMIFPYGRAFSGPKDTLSSVVVRQMTTNSEVREKLTSLCYVGKSYDDPSGLVELTFEQWMKSQFIFDKITRAVKIKEIHKSLSLSEQIQMALKKNVISENEAKILLEFDNARKKMIAVDEFTSEYALGSEALCPSKRESKQVG